MYVHFAGQIDKKTPKHNTPSCSVSFRESTHKNLEVIEKKATYLIYQYFPSVQCCRWKGRSNIKSIHTCSGRLIASRQLLRIQSLNLQLIRTFFIIKLWLLLVLVVMCSHSHQASDESCIQEMYSIFLQQHELILISSDVTAYARAFCGPRAHIFPSFFGKVVRAAISEL